MDIRFGSSGIRGRYPDRANANVAFELAKMLVRGFGRRVALGRDPRLSGPLLRAAFVSSALEETAELVDYGITPTPALSFETRSNKASCGVMVTASHNPPEYNGFKVFNGDGEALGDAGGLLGDKWRPRKNSRPSQSGSLITGEPTQYAETLSKISFRKKWKVVLDPGNGATYGLAASIYRRSLAEVTAINSLPDGRFPARGSEPTAESMKLLSNAVVETGAGAGIGFDGDGDRMFLVDEKGECPLQDRVLGFYISFLARRSRGPFLIPLDTSMAIDEVAERHGAKVIRGPVGDARLLQEMKRWNAKFAGEPSGAWIHGDVHPCPDGILSGLLYLKAVEDSELSVSQTVETIPEYYMMRRSLGLKSRLSRVKAALVGRKLKNALGKDSHTELKYGVRISSDRCWVLVRESGTEPVIRVTAESKDKAELGRIMSHAVRVVRQVAKTRA